MAANTKQLLDGSHGEELVTNLKSIATQLGDDLDLNDLKITHLSEAAFTNAVYRISWPITKSDDVERSVLVRIYGEKLEFFLDRDEEICTFQWMSDNGHGPRLFALLSNGRVEEFIHGRTLSAPDLRDPDISSLIATKLRKFHNVDKPGSKKPVLWDKLRQWVRKSNELCSPEVIEEFSLDGLEDEINELEKELSRDSQDIVFCHNDLSYSNILFNDETRNITIIDYEYASYNPVGYDFGNHFCEMAANYHSDTPHIVDYNKYPDLSERHRFIRTYLKSGGYQPTEIEVEKLAHDAEKYTLASHLFWTLWAILSDAYVNQVEFNYLEFARQRSKLYRSRKALLLDGCDSICYVDNVDNYLKVKNDEFDVKTSGVTTELLSV